MSAKHGMSHMRTKDIILGTVITGA
jgi:hypothetical protein